MVSENRLKLLTGGTPHDGTDRIHVATEKLYQELIDAEVSA
jgi:hypothetical protein